MNPFELVYKFNKEVIGLERYDVDQLAGSEQEWLIGAIAEELDELEVAYDKNDIPGQVDALIDTIYFAIGGLVRLGLTQQQAEKSFAVVHAANMAKICGRKARAVEHDLDAVKPADWNAPELAIRAIIFGERK